MAFETQIIPRPTIEAISRAYFDACTAIDHAYMELAQAEATLKLTLGSYNIYASFCLLPRNARWNHNKPEETIQTLKDELRRGVWYAITQQLQLNKVVSGKRATEITKKIESVDLPEPTVEEIYTVIMQFINEAPQYMTELMTEVFEYLRPSGSRYKTNPKFEIGRRVILSWTVEHSYRGKFRVMYGREDALIRLDKAFHLLDGKGIPDGYRSPLVLAIDMSETGLGETEYFKFKCCHNMNLHVEFKRSDLVQKLNQAAGGMRVRA